LFKRSLLPRLLIPAAARRATLLAVVAHVHRRNVNDHRVPPTFRTRLPRGPSLKAGLAVGHVYSPFCAGFFPAGLVLPRRPDSFSPGILYARRSATEKQAALCLASGWCWVW